MKLAPSKHSARNTTKNQNTGICYESKQNERKTALEVVEMAKELPHLKNQKIKYLLKN